MFGCVNNCPITPCDYSHSWLLLFPLVWSDETISTTAFLTMIIWLLTVLWVRRPLGSRPHFGTGLVCSSLVTFCPFLPRIWKLVTWKLKWAKSPKSRDTCVVSEYLIAGGGNVGNNYVRHDKARHKQHLIFKSFSTQHTHLSKFIKFSHSYPGARPRTLLWIKEISNFHKNPKFLS